MWDGVSGVPGLGYHIRRSFHKENINTEWNDKQHSSICSSLSNFRKSNHKCKHQLVYFCDSCGYGKDRLCDSYNSTCDSHQSTSSTDDYQVNRSDSYPQFTHGSLLPNFPNQNKSIILNTRNYKGLV